MTSSARPHDRLRHGLRYAALVHQPPARHGGQPPPHFRRRGHGAQRGLAGADRRAGRWRGRDPDPEVPWQQEQVLETIKKRSEAGRTFHLIVIAEGAGRATDLTGWLNEHSAEEHEVRACIPGHIQRAAARRRGSRIRRALRCARRRRAARGAQRDHDRRGAGRAVRSAAGRGDQRPPADRPRDVRAGSADRLGLKPAGQGCVIVKVLCCRNTG